MQITLKHATQRAEEDSIDLIAYLEYDNIIEITDKKNILVNHQ